jgi:hypothetical protein
MHLQIRAVPMTSPPDLARFLGVLKEAGVNLVAAGGGNLELGGEFACVPEHGQEDLAMDALRAAKYRPTLIEVGGPALRLCWLTDEPGQLWSCISEAAEINLAEGRVIADVLVGTERDDQGRVPVQVYSVEVKTASNSSAPRQR